MQPRFIVVPALKDGTTITPIWDERVKYDKEDFYGDSIKVEGESQQLIEVVYDLKKKVLIEGVTVDIYPKKTEFSVGDSVYHETKKTYRELIESTITDIVYEEYEYTIGKGERVDHFGIENFDPKTIYAVKAWKPTYVCADGFKTKWEHEMYKKAISE